MNDKVLNYTRPPLYDKQLDAFFCNERYSWCEASTKAGKTHSAIVWLAEQAITLGQPGRHFWWVAPFSGQAKIAYNRMVMSLPSQIFSKNDTDRVIKLKINGAVIEFKSGEKPDNLYGEDVYAAVIDEASRCREASWIAVRSTLTATKGPIRGIGNVKGRKNWFYNLSRKAEAGAKNMRYTKITAVDAVRAGVLDADEIRDAKNVLPYDVYKELYLCIPSDDGGNPFGIKNIQEMYNPDIDSGRPIAFGVDIAKSHDWTVIIGLDKNGREAYFERFQGNLGTAVKRIDNTCRGIPTVVDATSIGIRPTEELQELGDNYEPFVFSSKSKQMLMENLAIAIHNQELTIKSKTIKDELDIFEYEHTRNNVLYSAPSGAHDDCVIALGLAKYCLNHHKPREFRSTVI